MRKYLLHLLILVAVIASAIPVLIQPSSIDAATWYSTYAYSKKITITGSTDSAVTNYQMMITINKGSGSDNSTNVFCENHTLTTWDATHYPFDIRFTDSDNDTLMDYWVESFTSTTAVVWVEFDSIPISAGTATFYFYYGLAGAADASSGANTFIFFEDFTYDNWATQTKWQTNYSAKWSIAGGTVLYGANTESATVSAIASIAEFSGDTAMRTSCNITNTNYTYAGLMHYNDAKPYNFANHNSGSTNHSNVDYGNPPMRVAITTDALGFDAYHIYDFTRAVTGTDTIQFFMDGVQHGGNKTTTVPTEPWSVCYRTYKDTANSFISVDWTLVRNFRLVSPTWTAWGAEVSGTSAPTLHTDAATNVEETTATLNGEVTANGGAAITERGFEWGTATADYDWSWHEHDADIEVFSTNIASLTEGEAYYFRAYAINSVGTTYGSELKFLTKPLDPSTFVATLTAVHQIDLSWVNGHEADSTVIRALEGDFPANDRSDGAEVYNELVGVGTTYDDAGLDPGDHWYYKIWSYVTEDGMESWSDGPIQTNATVIEAPTVETQGATDVEETTADFQGAILTTGGIACTAGFEWGTTSGVYTEDWNDSPYGAVDFEYTGGVFVEGEAYYYRAYATNLEDTVYGAEEKFLTKPLEPTGFTAVRAPGDDSVIDLDWVAGTAADTTVIYGKIGSYPINIFDPAAVLVYDGALITFDHSGLTPGDHWYYKAWSWCTEDGKQQYSDAVDYADAIACTEPTVTTNDPATDIGDFSATLHGEITDTGGFDSTIVGFVWGLDLGGPYPNDIHTDGVYGAAVFDIPSGNVFPAITNIYYMAYTTGPIGTSFGAEDTFETLLPLPLRPTNFTGTLVGTDNVDLTWTLGTWAVDTIIMRRLDRFPTSLTDGVEVYNGPAALVTDVLTGTGEQEGYYSAWSRNATGDSVNYTTLRIGGTVMLLIALIGLGCFFTFFSAWRRYLPSSMAGSITWLALGSLWLVSPTTIGVTTTDTWTPYIGFVFVLATLVPIMLYAKPLTTMHRETTMKDAFGRTISSGWEEQRHKPNNKSTSASRQAAYRAQMHAAINPPRKRR